MARLSVSDLNSLSGITDDGLRLLYNSFREAHTRVYNKSNKWIQGYMQKKAISDISDWNDTKTVEKMYYTMREAYYEGSMTLDEIDLFDEYVSDYVSLLSKLRRNDVISEIMQLNSIIQANKKKIIGFLPECYEIWEYGYSKLNSEEGGL